MLKDYANVLSGGKPIRRYQHAEEERNRKEEDQKLLNNQRLKFHQQFFSVAKEHQQQQQHIQRMQQLIDRQAMSSNSMDEHDVDNSHSQNGTLTQQIDQTYPLLQEKIAAESLRYINNMLVEKFLIANSGCMCAHLIAALMQVTHEYRYIKPVLVLAFLGTLFSLMHSNSVQWKTRFFGYIVSHTVFNFYQAVFCLLTEQEEFLSPVSFATFTINCQCIVLMVMLLDRNELTNLTPGWYFVLSLYAISSFIFLLMIIQSFAMICVWCQGLFVTVLIGILLKNNLGDFDSYQGVPILGYFSDQVSFSEDLQMVIKKTISEEIKMRVEKETREVAERSSQNSQPENQVGNVSTIQRLHDTSNSIQSAIFNLDLFLNSLSSNSNTSYQRPEAFRRVQSLRGDLSLIHAQINGININHANGSISFPNSNRIFEQYRQERTQQFQQQENVIDVQQSQRYASLMANNQFSRIEEEVSSQERQSNPSPRETLQPHQKKTKTHQARFDNLNVIINVDENSFPQYFDLSHLQADLRQQILGFIQSQANQVTQGTLVCKIHWQNYHRNPDFRMDPIVNQIDFNHSNDQNRDKHIEVFAIVQQQSNQEEVKNDSQQQAILAAFAQPYLNQSFGMPQNDQVATNQNQQESFNRVQGNERHEEIKQGQNTFNDSQRSLDLGFSQKSSDQDQSPDEMIQSENISNRRSQPQQIEKREPKVKFASNNVQSNEERSSFQDYDQNNDELNAQQRPQENQLHERLPVSQKQSEKSLGTKNSSEDDSCSAEFASRVIRRVKKLQKENENKDNEDQQQQNNEENKQQINQEHLEESKGNHEESMQLNSQHIKVNRLISFGGEDQQFVNQQHQANPRLQASSGNQIIQEFSNESSAQSLAQRSESIQEEEKEEEVKSNDDQIQQQQDIMQQQQEEPEVQPAVQVQEQPPAREEVKQPCRMTTQQIEEEMEDMLDCEESAALVVKSQDVKEATILQKSYEHRQKQRDSLQKSSNEKELSLILKQSLDEHKEMIKKEKNQKMSLAQLIGGSKKKVRSNEEPSQKQQKPKQESISQPVTPPPKAEKQEKVNQQIMSKTQKEKDNKKYRDQSFNRNKSLSQIQKPLQLQINWRNLDKKLQSLNDKEKSRLFSSDSIHNQDQQNVKNERKQDERSRKILEDEKEEVKRLIESSQKIQQKKADKSVEKEQPKKEKKSNQKLIKNLSKSDENIEAKQEKEQKQLVAETQKIQKIQTLQKDVVKVSPVSNSGSQSQKKGGSLFGNYNFAQKQQDSKSASKSSSSQAQVKSSFGSYNFKAAQDNKNNQNNNQTPPNLLNQNKQGNSSSNQRSDHRINSFSSQMSAYERCSSKQSEVSSKQEEDVQQQQQQQQKQPMTFSMRAQQVKQEPNNKSPTPPKQSVFGQQQKQSPFGKKSSFSGYKFGVSTPSNKDQNKNQEKKPDIEEEKKEEEPIVQNSQEKKTLKKPSLKDIKTKFASRKKEENPSEARPIAFSPTQNGGRKPIFSYKDLMQKPKLIKKKELGKLELKYDQRRRANSIFTIQQQHVPVISVSKLGEGGAPQQNALLKPAEPNKQVKDPSLLLRPEIRQLQPPLQKIPEETKNEETKQQPPQQLLQPPVQSQNQLQPIIQRARSKSITGQIITDQNKKGTCPISRLNNYTPNLKRHRGSIVSMVSNLESIKEEEKHESNENQNKSHSSGSKSFVDMKFQQSKKSDNSRVSSKSVNSGQKSSRSQNDEEQKVAQRNSGVDDQKVQQDPFGFGMLPPNKYQRPRAQSVVQGMEIGPAQQLGVENFGHGRRNQLRKKVRDITAKQKSQQDRAKQQQQLQIQQKLPFKKFQLSFNVKKNRQQQQQVPASGNKNHLNPSSQRAQAALIALSQLSPRNRQNN